MIALKNARADRRDDRKCHYNGLGPLMISLEGCIEYLRLTEEAFDAIAAHEHVPAMIPVEPAGDLDEVEDGERMTRRTILEAIATPVTGAILSMRESSP